ncbi:hypothetical protein NC651_035276 [Populus alba x Populus x berolinensis]|nr:hypothetical protein NC651_035276 [Populus alba x Populus x berolinensis]
MFRLPSPFGQLKITHLSASQNNEHLMCIAQSCFSHAKTQ